MKNTCEPKTCKLYELLGGTPEQCPNFIESWWKPLEGDPVLIQDCSPKRILLVHQELFNRVIGLQKAQEEQRNESVKVLQSIFRLTQSLSHIVDVKKQIVEGEYKEIRLDSPALPEG